MDANYSSRWYILIGTHGRVIIVTACVFVTDGCWRDELNHENLGLKRKGTVDFSCGCNDRKKTEIEDPENT